MAMSIGGLMVRRMIEQYERNLKNETSDPKDNETEICKNEEKEE
jgi:hypothetical protein